jgi:hypothetical protein
MPYKSRAQEAWAHTPEGMKALGGAAKVAEWDSASKGMKLPERKAPPRGGIFGNALKGKKRRK